MYDESVFMWTPTEYTTISVFTCWDASVPFSQFSTTPGDPAAIFSLSNREIASIKMVAAPEGAVEYRQYSRQHGHVFSEVNMRMLRSETRFYRNLSFPSGPSLVPSFRQNVDFCGFYAINNGFQKSNIPPIPSLYQC